ncbi:hypothetical protein QQF64_020035 [Cirrhinus molitorella]|uniref:Secreted protein n=1 Tax=Cirrhinus molitorella TaxID=172907 RepID=A0ABR3LKJ0_9TELE
MTFTVLSFLFLSSSSFLTPRLSGFVGFLLHPLGLPPVDPNFFSPPPPKTNKQRRRGKEEKSNGDREMKKKDNKSQTRRE